MDNQELAKQTLDQIPQANRNAKHIVGLIKEGGRVAGYQLSDNTLVDKQQAVSMAKQGQIAGVGIAHRGDTEYLKLKSVDHNNFSCNYGYYVHLKIKFSDLFLLSGYKKIFSFSILAHTKH